MSSFKIIELPVLKKKVLKVYDVWAWQRSWSCDLDHLYNILSASQGRRRQSPRVNHFSFTHLLSQLSPLLQVVPQLNDFPHSNV